MSQGSFDFTVLLDMEGLSRHARNKLLYSSEATSQVKLVVWRVKTLVNVVASVRRQSFHKCLDRIKCIATAEQIGCSDSFCCAHPETWAFIENSSTHSLHVPVLSKAASRDWSHIGIPFAFEVSQIGSLRPGITPWWSMTVCTIPSKLKVREQAQTSPFKILAMQSIQIQSMFFRERKFYRITNWHAILQDIICKELVVRISEQGSAIARAMRVAAELDCVLSLALTAKAHNLACPNLTTENVLQVHEGRIQIIVRLFVAAWWPSHLTLACLNLEDSGQILWYGGPNQIYLFFGTCPAVGDQSTTHTWVCTRCASPTERGMLERYQYRGNSACFHL